MVWNCVARLSCNQWCPSGRNSLDILKVYLDDLSIALSACRTGCCVGNSLINNHLMYADDLVIFSSSSIGLRALITVCEEYAVSHEMVFNHTRRV